MERLVFGLLASAPELLLWGTALLAALVRWPRHPMVSAVLVAAVVVFAGQWIAAALVYSLGVEYLVRSGFVPNENLASLLVAAGVLFSALRALAMGAVFLACLAWRGPAWSHDTR